jgi:transcriptional regulator with XRE-family HTH domain
MSAFPFCHIVLHSPKPVSDTWQLAPKSFGDHLKKRRLELGLLQREVAAQLGVDRTSVASWEKDNTFPPSRYLPGIIRFIGYQPFADVLDKSIGEKLVLLRQLLGITQDELAARFSVGRSTLGRWERGSVSPPERVIETVDAWLIVQIDGTECTI